MKIVTYNTIQFPDGFLPLYSHKNTLIKHCSIPRPTMRYLAFSRSRLAQAWFNWKSLSSNWGNPW